MKEVWDELAVLYHEYLRSFHSHEEGRRWTAYRGARDAMLTVAQKGDFWRAVTNGVLERWRAERGMSL